MQTFTSTFFLSLLLWSGNVVWAQSPKINQDQVTCTFNGQSVTTKKACDLIQKMGHGETLVVIGERDFIELTLLVHACEEIGGVMDEDSIMVDNRQYYFKTNTLVRCLKNKDEVHAFVMSDGGAPSKPRVIPQSNQRGW